MVSWADYVKQRATQTVGQLNARYNSHAVEQFQDWSAGRRQLLDQLADEKKFVIRASESDDADLTQAQHVVDELVAQGRDAVNDYYNAERLPEHIQVVVHQGDGKQGWQGTAYSGLHSGMDAAYNRDIVETHQSRFPKSLADGSWKFASAHEIGHIINQDTDPAHQVERMKKKPSHQMEIEADLMATILHGDIQGQRDWRAGLPDFESTVDQPGNVLRAKYLDRWNHWLEESGAAKEGSIIDREKALDIFPGAFETLQQGLVGWRLGSASNGYRR